MATGRLTKRSVDAALPQERETFIWDIDVKGFGLRITSKGAKTYLLQYRMGGREAPTRRYTIGSHGSPWSPDGARQRAIGLLADIRKGIDPQLAERLQRRVENDLAFDAYVDRFIDRYAKRAQPRSWHQAAQCLQNHAVPQFRGRSLPSIDHRDIVALLDKVEDSAPALARYLHATLRRMFRWAVERGDIQHSPMTAMSPPTPVSARERILADPEVGAVWIVASQLGFPFGPIFRLLILTGQRREEVGAMRWEELDLNNATWVIPSERAKNGRAHLVPLSAPAMSELTKLECVASGFVFSTTGKSAPSGWSKAKLRLDALLRESSPGMISGPWRTHDIRRTLATGLQRLGVRFEVTEAVLNHVSGSRGGVAGVYQRHNWAEEKRTALESWGRLIEALADGRTDLGASDNAMIIPLSSRAA